MSKVLSEETSHSDLLVSLLGHDSALRDFPFQCFQIVFFFFKKKTNLNILTGPLPGKKSFAILCPLRESWVLPKLYPTPLILLIQEEVNTIPKQKGYEKRHHWQTLLRLSLGVALGLLQVWAKLMAQYRVGTFCLHSFTAETWSSSSSQARHTVAMLGSNRDNECVCACMHVCACVLLCVKIHMCMDTYERAVDACRGRRQARYSSVAVHLVF